jgi:hypothetical protein
MKVILYRRHYGIHTPVKETEIDGKFEDYYLGEDQINEDLLLKNLPKGFLPVDPSKVLLSVQIINDETGEIVSGRGQRGLKKFRNWAKYFDAYNLELCRK